MRIGKGGPRERKSRLDSAGQVVGGPTNRKIGRLKPGAFLSYEEAIQAQVQEGRVLSDGRKVALDKVLLRIQREHVVRERA